MTKKLDLPFEKLKQVDRAVSKNSFRLNQWAQGLRKVLDQRKKLELSYQARKQKLALDVAAKNEYFTNSLVDRMETQSKLQAELNEMEAEGLVSSAYPEQAQSLMEKVKKNKELELQINQFRGELNDLG